MENSKKINLALFPVLFGFFIMGFCDLVGISTSYMKDDFQLSETVAGFIPSMVFCWFLVCSVPTAILMNRIGRKKTVLLGNLVTFAGMIVPFLSYNFMGCLVGFVFLGIGNTILQVSLNPLLTNVVKAEALASSLTAGQVVKAVSSLCGPFVAAFAAAYFGMWQYLFPIFAMVTLLSSLWLVFTPIDERESAQKASSLQDTFALLKNKTILLLFLGIVFIVGTDVGMNTVTPKLLIERCGMPVGSAGFGSSLYFFCRTIGAFVGVIILRKMNAMAYYRIHIGIALAAMSLLYFMQSEVSILVMVGVIGFACSSIFPVIYSMAMQAMPHKANEISGLMITGVCGGAIIPPFMGYAADTVGAQSGSLIIITLSMLYLAYCSFFVRVK